ncbi:MAG: glycosyltransferase family 2 protein [Cyclobacteriaceae bacterium]
MGHINIIIVNYNTPEDVKECILNLKKEVELIDYRLFIVDNGSTRGNYSTLKQYFGEYLESKSLILQRGEIDKISLDYKAYLIESVNSGFAGGNNLVLKVLLEKCHEEYVLLLNPDVVVEKGSIYKLKSLSNHIKTRKFVLGSRVYNYFNKSQLIHNGTFRVNTFSGMVKPNLESIPPSRLNYVYGGFLFTPLESFRKIGLIKEEYFLYWEEVEWCHRANSMGYELMVSESIRVFDKVGGSAGRGFLANYYFTRNGLYFVKLLSKNYLFNWPILFHLVRACKQLVLLNTSVASGILIGMKDYMLRKKGKR